MDKDMEMLMEAYDKVRKHKGYDKAERKAKMDVKLRKQSAKEDDLDADVEEAEKDEKEKVADSKDTKK